MRRKLTTLWDGWTFDGEHICDLAGNKWSQESLYAALMGEQLYKELAGTPLQVASLKKELEKRIAALAPPEIVVHWQGQQVRLKLG